MSINKDTVRYKTKIVEKTERSLGGELEMSCKVRPTDTLSVGINGDESVVSFTSARGETSTCVCIVVHESDIERLHEVLGHYLEVRKEGKQQ